MASPNALAAALGAAPAPPSSPADGYAAAGAPSPDAVGAGAAPSDPSQGAPFQAQGNGPMYPTTDPGFMQQLLQQVLQVQQQDQAHFMGDQTHALTDNPIFHALVSGAPMGPGAGQDGSAIGPDAGVMPQPQ